MLHAQPDREEPVSLLGKDSIKVLEGQKNTEQFLCQGGVVFLSRSQFAQIGCDQEAFLHDDGAEPGITGIGIGQRACCGQDPQRCSIAEVLLGMRKVGNVHSHVEDMIPVSYDCSSLNQKALENV
jgi:hypothetical protein